MGGGLPGRVFDPGFTDQTARSPPHFEQFCSIKDALEDYPVLDEADYSEREYLETLANYRSEMWRETDLPEGWESEVYSWFSDNGMDEFTENKDDRGGWAPREKIVEALAGPRPDADRGGRDVKATKLHDHLEEPTDALYPCRGF